MYRVVRVLNKVSNLSWEQRLGIDTRGSETHKARNDNFYYCTIAYKDIFSILDYLNLHKEDTFIDIGCGKGRAICCAAQYRLKEVIGIDYDKDLCKVAERNIRSLKQKKSHIRVIHSPAEQFDYHTGTVFYLFNPFCEEILKQVVHKIKISHSNHKRNIRIVYVNPVYETLLENIGGIKMLDKWRPSFENGYRYMVNFYSVAGS